MRSYSVNQIEELYSEFRELKFYKEKILFFDLHFGIIPFDFPDFSSELPIFFTKEKIQLLVDIYNQERKSPALLERHFSFNDKNFRFDIKPTNSNNPVYNSFIISRFLAVNAAAKNFDNEDKPANEPIKKILADANDRINYIESVLQDGYDVKNFLPVFMNVFYKGLQDAFKKKIGASAKKKKFIELYLYAQGILYAEFINQLKAMNKYGNMKMWKCENDGNSPS